MIWRNKTLVLLLLVNSFLLTGCPDDSDDGDPKDVTCSYDGQEYSPGDSFPCTDGCNTCACESDGTVSSTMLACVPTDAPTDATCEYEGQIYQAGESFLCSDGCNDCACTSDGGVISTTMACEPEDICEYNGQTYQIGDSFTDADGCNNCSCIEGGQVACTDMACEPEDICEYNGQTYKIGDSFEDADGCNSCSCIEGGHVVCTEMACMPEGCADGLTYHEPGCGGEEGMPVITPGCYEPCNGTACSTGICQQTDINPCICEEGMDCCDACGSWEWLCLDTPESCPNIGYAPMITAAGKSFGECLGDCDFDITFSAGEAGECLAVTLTVCDTGGNSGCTRQNLGTLTPAGHAKVTGYAAELMGAPLEETYGCPDCADGGASQLTLEFDGVETALSYEYGNPPEILKKADTFTQGLIDALNTCTSNDDIVIGPSDCTP